MIPVIFFLERTALGSFESLLSMLTYEQQVFDYEVRCVYMSRSQARFSKYSMSGSPYFLDVELTQIEKTELYSAMFFLDH